MGTSEMCYWCFYLLRHPQSSSLQLCQSIAQQYVVSWPPQSAHNTQHAKEQSLRQGRQCWFGTWPRREHLKVKGLLCTESCLSVGGRGLIPKQGSWMQNLPSSSKQKCSSRAVGNFTARAKVSLTCNKQSSERKTNWRQAEKHPRVSVCTIDPCWNARRTIELEPSPAATIFFALNGCSKYFWAKMAQSLWTSQVYFLLEMWHWIWGEDHLPCRGLPQPDRSDD